MCSEKVAGCQWPGINASDTDRIKLFQIIINAKNNLGPLIVSETNILKSVTFLKLRH